MTTALTLSETLAVGGTTTIKVRFNPAEHNASRTTLTALLKASLGVQAGYPDAELPRVTIVGESQKTNLMRKLQIQNEDGVWNTWTASSYDWGEIL